MSSTKKKRIKTVVTVLAWILGAFLAMKLFLLLLGIGTWQGSDFKTYRRRARCPSGYYLTELPEGAQDFRFKAYNVGVGAYSCAGFTLTGDDYTDYVDSLSDLPVPDYCSAGCECVGRTVAETADYYDNNGRYAGFRCLDIIDYVIDDDIDDYTVIYLESYDGSNSHLSEVAANPETGRIVVVTGGSN